VDGAGDEFLAGAGLSRDEHGGICGSDPGDPGQSGLQRLGGTDNFLEHEGSVDLVAQPSVDTQIPPLIDTAKPAIN
jgi:hypothetical protein